jgi:hypothetical protein
VSEREPDHQAGEERALRCTACGTPYRAGDRFCAQCGASLPEPEQGPPQSAQSEDVPQEQAAWVLGARPVAVIVGGIALLVLAALLLAIGQRDDTGTIVMLSICTAPLGLLALVIGIARYIASTARRNESRSRGVEESSE